MMHGKLQRRVWLSTDLFRVLALCLSAGMLLTAGNSGGSEVFTGVSLKVLNSSAPPGGTMQLMVALTEPKPIIIGRAAISFDPTVLGAVQGLAVYGANGASSDAAGAAVMSASGLTIRTTSPSASFGTAPGVPIVAVTIAVRPDAAPGAHASLVLDPAASLWLDPTGQPYPQQVKSGTFEVGGSVSIDDVFPGGGFLLPGSTVTVRGAGFQPGTVVEIDGVPIASVNFVSSTQLDVVIAEGADLYGRRVTAKNPDLSRAAYFSYLRASWLGRSTRPLLAATDPIFSPVAISSAFLGPPPDPAAFLALALQNPNADPSDVTIELRSAAGVIASTAITLPPRTRISREVSELLSGITLESSSFLLVRSTLPLQMLGLIGNEASGTVEPVVPSVAFP